MKENTIRYDHVAWIDEEKNISLVQDKNNGELRVQKTARIFDKNVFEVLRSHPVKGLPRIYEYYEEDGTLIVIEEYITGKNLEKLLDEKGVMSVAKVRDIALKLCDILASLSELGIIHRDIKPSNIMQREDGEIVLVDFNAAKIMKASQNRDTRLLGTEGFAAPEQFGFGSSNAQTDIYGLGILMLVLLTEDTSISSLPDNELSPVIKKCTKLNSKDRYTNTQQLKKALLSGGLKLSTAKLSLMSAALVILIFTAIMCVYFYRNNTTLPTGIYKGNDSEILVINDTGTATYYCSDIAYQETACPWSYDNGKLTITLDKLHCDITANVKKNDFDQLLFVSDSSNWSAELFERTNLTEYNRKLQTYDKALTVMDSGDLSFSLLGMDFTADKKWCDFEDEFDAREDIIALASVDAEHNVAEALLYYADANGADTGISAEILAPFAAKFLEDLTISAPTEGTIMDQPALTAELTGTLNISFGSLSGKACEGTLTLIEAPDHAGTIYVLELK